MARKSNTKDAKKKIMWIIVRDIVFPDNDHHIFTWGLTQRILQYYQMFPTPPISFTKAEREIERKEIMRDIRQSIDNAFFPTVSYREKFQIIEELCENMETETMRDSLQDVFDETTKEAQKYTPQEVYKMFIHLLTREIYNY